MKIIFANDTLAKLKFLALSDEAGSGFLRTERLGRYILITDMITGNICKGSVTGDMQHIYELWGTGFGGIFVKGKHEIFPECFLEKLVVEVDREGYNIFHFDSDSDEQNLITRGIFANS